MSCTNTWVVAVFPIRAGARHPPSHMHNVRPFENQRRRHDRSRTAVLLYRVCHVYLALTANILHRHRSPPPSAAISAASSPSRTETIARPFKCQEMNVPTEQLPSRCCVEFDRWMLLSPYRSANLRDT